MRAKQKIIECRENDNQPAFARWATSWHFFKCEAFEKVVGTTGIEPVTPTMSKSTRA